MELIISIIGGAIVILGVVLKLLVKHRKSIARSPHEKTPDIPDWRKTRSQTDSTPPFVGEEPKRERVSPRQGLSKPGTVNITGGPPLPVTAEVPEGESIEFGTEVHTSAGPLTNEIHPILKEPIYRDSSGEIVHRDGLLVDPAFLVGYDVENLPNLPGEDKSPAVVATDRAVAESKNGEAKEPVKTYVLKSHGVGRWNIKEGQQLTLSRRGNVEPIHKRTDSPKFYGFAHEDGTRGDKIEVRVSKHAVKNSK